MTVETMIEAGVKVFKQKVMEFCAAQAEGPLDPRAAESVARGLQAALAAAGAETYRAYLESHEVHQDVVRADGDCFRFKYASERTFMTLFGPMRVTRRVYQNASDTKTHVPLDAAWGMAGEFLTVEVREAVAFACAHVTPEETAELLAKSALFRPHATQIKRAVESIGRVVAAQGERIDEGLRAQEAIPEASRVLAASLDGVNVLMRDTEGGKRGRPAERPGLEKTQANTTAYKNAMVGSVSIYGEPDQTGEGPERLVSRYVTHMPEERAPSFKAKFEAELEAAENKAPPGIAKVLICDGARGLWNYIETSGRFDEYETLIDYWHALEHLSLAAEVLFGKGNPRATEWYRTYAKKLLECDDGAARIVRSMDYHDKTAKLPKARREALAAQRRYFLRNSRGMTYAEFRRRGLPIGSGPVEAACKTLVKTRLCRSGMRWTREGGQRILDLRTYVKSNRWQPFWNQYKKANSAA